MILRGLPVAHPDRIVMFTDGTPSRVIRGMLVQTSQNDPVTLTSLAGLLAAVAMCAVIVPALRASRIDPNVALRRE
jgi:ABC-type lipoprotein release transport system permease subunit